MSSNNRLIGGKAVEIGKDYFEVTIVGLGGQGALIIGRLLAEAGTSKYRHVTYLPNYGATMRGGDTECTVIFSTKEISSPATLEPWAAIVMGSASVAEFEKRIRPGGMMMMDSTANKIERDDVKAIYIPAKGTAAELGNTRVANFVFLGAYVELTQAIPWEALEKQLEKQLKGGRDAAMLEIDMRAMREGARLAREMQ
jgi:2-oxoglutarate ferredoxin oxidoreductase subunit gamma